ncbi:hypothetical protein [Paraburkholderia sp.]|uniref:hypothetical protein n=1 Tax=Paraburkholderia sp. TaxID=1926495 RepID=UPI003C7C49BD
MDPEELASKARDHRLEKWKVFLSILTPLVLLALTYVVNNAIQEKGAALTRQEQILSEKQKIYADLGPRLNTIYIYVVDVGDFRSYSPVQIVKEKREADQKFFTYGPYWSAKTEKNYDAFMSAAFQTYNGAGLPAKIRTSRDQKIAAYNVDHLTWDNAWDAYFTGAADSEISDKYNDLVSSLLADTVSSGVRDVRAEKKRPPPNSDVNALIKYKVRHVAVDLKPILKVLRM